MLIFLIVSLWEVLAFQKTVESLAGESDRALQRVLHAVDHAESELRRRPKEELAEAQLPYAQMAITVDSMRNASVLLGRFQGLTFDRSADVQQKTALDVLTALKSDTATLVNSLYKHREDAKLASLFDELHQSLGDFKQFDLEQAQIKASQTLDAEVQADAQPKAKLEVAWTTSFMPRDFHEKRLQFETARTGIIEQVGALLGWSTFTPIALR